MAAKSIKGERMYKLAVLDIDETLLTPRKKVTRYTRKVIRSLRGKNIPVTLCTGRNLQLTQPFVEKLGIHVPFSCADGTMVYHPNGEILYHNNIESKDFKKIINQFKNNNAYMIIPTQEAYYKWIPSKKLKQYEIYGHGTIKSFFANRYANIQRIHSLEEMISKGKAHQVIIGGSPDSLKQWKNELQTELGVLYEVNDQVWPGYLVVHKKGNHKGKAVGKICSYLGIELHEVVAIGDEHNDVDMIKTVGCGIAMENAVDILKNVADDITLSNRKNGAAYALKHYFLDEQMSPINRSRI